MRLPVAVGNLVADQRIARGGIGNAQQRLGEAHQRHTFLARQRIFMHQPFDARTLVLGAQRLDQLARGGAYRLAVGFRQGGLFEQGGNTFGFRAAIGGGDRLTQRRLLADRRSEIVEDGSLGGSGLGGGGFVRHGGLNPEQEAAPEPFGEPLVSLGTNYHRLEIRSALIYIKDRKYDLIIRCNEGNMDAKNSFRR